jgi:hypothetical protein
MIKLERYDVLQIRRPGDDWGDLSTLRTEEEFRIARRACLTGMWDGTAAEYRVVGSREHGSKRVILAPGSDGSLHPSGQIVIGHIRDRLNRIQTESDPAKLSELVDELSEDIYDLRIALDLPKKED